MKHSVCVLVSGGLDSCVMVASLARRCRNIHPVFIRQGLAWEEAELRALRKFLGAANRKLGSGTLAPLTILELPARDLYGNHWSTTGRKVPGLKTHDEAVYLPGRNLLLLSKAAVFCTLHRIDTIAVGSLGHNPFLDATPKFFRDFARAANQALNTRVNIIAPFRTLTKEQVVRRGHRLGLPLHLSFSCLAPRRGLHCGHCNKCAERRRAFRAAAIKDLTHYATAH